MMSVTKSAYKFLLCAFLFIGWNEALVIPYQFDDVPDDPLVNMFLTLGSFSIMAAGLYVLQPFFKVIYPEVYNKEIKLWKR